jgi:hypothetical protein
LTRHQARAEKIGRVVDVETRRGIPDATIIASWRTTTSGVPGLVSAENWCDLQRVTVSDSEGRFTIPDVSHELDSVETNFGPLSHNSIRSRLLLGVFKQGYVRAGDLERLPEHERERFSWQVESPRLSGLGRSIRVETITMEKADLSAPDEWIYKSAILGTGRCRDGQGKVLDQPAFKDLAKTIGSRARNEPCQMAAADEISPEAVGAFGWVLDDGEFLARLRQLADLKIGEPKGTNAGTICRALNGAGSQE